LKRPQHIAAWCHAQLMRIDHRQHMDYTQYWPECPGDAGAIDGAALLSQPRPAVWINKLPDVFNSTDEMDSTFSNRGWRTK